MISTSALIRHPGLVPGSKVPHTHQPLLSRNLGPRHKAGVTNDGEAGA